MTKCKAALLCQNQTLLDSTIIVLAYICKLRGSRYLLLHSQQDWGYFSGIFQFNTLSENQLSKKHHVVENVWYKYCLVL